jgi:hypothetical protein
MLKVTVQHAREGHRRVTALAKSLRVMVDGSSSGLTCQTNF